MRFLDLSGLGEGGSAMISVPWEGLLVCLGGEELVVSQRATNARQLRSEGVLGGGGGLGLFRTGLGCSQWPGGRDLVISNESEWRMTVSE